MLPNDPADLSSAKYTTSRAQILLRQNCVVLLAYARNRTSHHPDVSVRVFQPLEVGFEPIAGDQVLPVVSKIFR